jgi:hypothetical protein
LHPQTAQRIEELLDSEALRNEQAAWLVLEAAEAVYSGSPAEAFRYAADRQWFSGSAAPDNRITLDQASLLIMKAFDIKGGLFYTLTGAPHYAYRELEYQGILQGKVDPRMRVSGDLLLFIVNRVLSYKEDNWL